MRHDAEQVQSAGMIRVFPQDVPAQPARRITLSLGENLTGLP
jgi:hypothetical protein